jgi:hypothetical protein
MAQPYVPATSESIRFLRFELEFAQQETEWRYQRHAPVIGGRSSTVEPEFERKDRSSKGNGGF